MPPSDLSEQILSPNAKQFSSFMAYNNVKLCNVLFARGLAMVLHIYRMLFATLNIQALTNNTLKSIEIV